MTYEEKYKLHDQLRQYSYSFFVKVKKDLNAERLDENIIPIIFFDEPSDHFNDYDESGNPHRRAAGVTLSLGKQSVIKVFDCDNHPIEELEQTVRHECIHYILWVLGLKDKDNTAVFHLMCEKYDAAADEPMSDEEQDLYNKYQTLKKIIKCDSIYSKKFSVSYVRNILIAIFFKAGNKDSKEFNELYNQNTNPTVINAFL